MARPRGRALDVALIVLALASVVVFGIAVSGKVGAFDARILRAVDLALVIAYAALFVAKGALDERPARWFRRHAWLAFALLPLTIPILVAAPYFLVVQLVVVLLRVAKAIDRALHLHVMAGLSERYRVRLVEELTTPLLLDLARIMEDAVTSQDYAAAMGERLRSRRGLIEAAVRRGIEASPRLSRFASLGPVRRVIDETTQEVVDAAHATLTGPELNTLIREAFHDAFAKLRDGIREPKWPHRGVGFRDAAHLVAHEVAHARGAPRDALPDAAALPAWPSAPRAG